jgi:phenol 2-monooxygenase
MNVSMADAFNLGWKLAWVIKILSCSDLLRPFSAERRAKAKELIDFDRDMARLFSASPQNAAEAEQFQQYFKKHGRYTAGVETRYDTSMITQEAANQELARGFPVGMRFHSHPVLRLADAKPVQLGHEFKADGRWRLIIFANRDDHGQVGGQVGGQVAQICEFLMKNPASPIQHHTRDGAALDAVIDVRAVFQEEHRNLELENLPALLIPKKGRFGLIDYEKIYCPSAKNLPNIFDARGIDRNKGAIVVLRPDQFVAGIFSPEKLGAMAEFFASFMTPIQILK